jgi:very-short-patch-repair endonuclease
MGTETAMPDWVVAGLADDQHGVVTNLQLLQAGLSKKAIVGRVRRGQFHRVHQGVYSVGHPRLDEEGRSMAAVLATATEGRPAFLSHRSAAVLLKLLSPPCSPIEVVVTGYAGRMRREGIRIHRTETLENHHVMTRSGIPVTTPARTIADLIRAPRRWRLPASLLKRAIRQAGVLGYPLGSGVAWDGTRSELETLFLALCKRHRLPAPEVNGRVAGHEVDFHWPGRNLVVETDGFRFHRGPQAFENDRRRDLDLKLAGYEVEHLTFSQVTKDPEEQVVQLLRRRLASGAMADLVPHRQKSSQTGGG